MKLHSKPPANHLQTAFRVAHPALFSLLFTLFSLRSPASVPLAWQVTPRNPAPVAFDRHHGETLEFRCTFTGFGELPFSGSGGVAPRLYYQTNGMAAAWWSVPASVSSNVLSATFPPSADPGADRLALFFGAPSNAYASAVLRLRHSPGFAPNILPPPEQATFEETDPVFAAWLAATELVHEEQDPTVPAWAKSPTPPASGLSTNDVCDIVTNEVQLAEWTYGGLPDGAVLYYPPEYSESQECWIAVMTYNGISYDGTSFVGPDATDFVFKFVDPGVETPEEYIVTATLRRQVRNALGLARLTDLPPLTNGLTTNDVVNIVTNTTPSAWQTFTNGVPCRFGVVWLEDPKSWEFELIDINPYWATWTPDGENARDFNATELSFYGDFLDPPITFEAKRIAPLGLARLVDLQPLTNDVPSMISAAAQSATNYTDSATNSLNQSIAPTVSAAIAATDTSYPRVIGITNINQTVQYVSINSDVPTTLSIMLPTSGDTKDWIVYVTSQTNVTISLPAATWWLADTSATNDIAPQTPTALYFSQAADNIYTMGRQEFTEIVLP